jgi:hypothetical protein
VARRRQPGCWCIRRAASPFFAYLILVTRRRFFVVWLVVTLSRSTHRRTQEGHLSPSMHSQTGSCWLCSKLIDCAGLRAAETGRPNAIEKHACKTACTRKRNAITRPAAAA